MLTPADGDRVMVKPRFSAFFDTQLDDVLSREGINTVVLAGTTTPNCVRSTCYDALSLNYNVVVLEDATSSRTPEVQRANIEDMAYIGAHIMSVAEFLEQGLSQVQDIAGDTARAIEAEYYAADRASGQTDGRGDGCRSPGSPHIGSPSPHARLPHVGADGHDRAAHDAHFNRCKRTSRNARSEGDLGHHDWRIDT